MSTVNPLTDLGLALKQPEVKKQQLGQEEFLRLMTAQLQNQDPFKPMENGEFLGQIAQFSTVSGIQSMQESIAGLAASLQSNQALQGAQLVGHGVLVESESAYLPAQGGLQAAAELPASGQLIVEITDGAGQVVRRLDYGAQPAGMAYFEWDGLDAAGTRLPEGSYGIRARTIQGATQQSASTLAVGVVGSVSLAATGLTLNLVGMPSVPLSQVRQIL